MLAFLAAQAPVLILLIGVLHFSVFFYIRRSGRAEAARLKSYLATLHRFVNSRADADVTKKDLDLVEDYLGDLTRFVESPDFTSHAGDLKAHLAAKSESLNLKGVGMLRSLHSPARAFIEAYPFLGIIGTLLAMTVALPATGGSEVADAAALSGLFASFSSAIWSTIFGLLMAIGFLMVNAAIEPAIDRLVEDEHLTRALVLRINSQLPAQSKEGAG